VRAVNELAIDAELTTSQDLLHVPTPWHSCIVEIAGHPTLYATKVEVVTAALRRGDFEGDWHLSDSGESACGAHFRLSRPAGRPERPASTAASTLDSNSVSSGVSHEKAGATMLYSMDDHKQEMVEAGNIEQTSTQITGAGQACGTMSRLWRLCSCR
jgi:hypothetical protein